ncbi:hypothetical protein [Alkalicoccobacillus porphyridii]|uniref:Uncharacterized protein n=1 Tax=Alkalicoccobacillus porphyridii TaxID=2597270 RepID=A0A553ZVX9_9BACI|nr:hypothetical protein [Alkalicoccobacillus porphyridii]TSB45617.1 hypothetical protein FN960_15735 [Alkalicoccobacillus porphyridii]
MRRLNVAMFVSLLFLSACSFSFDVYDAREEQDEEMNEASASSNEKEPIQLQLTKSDEEAGVTTENNELYQQLDMYVSDNPDAGADNDFSVESMTMIVDSEGNQQMVFLGFNRIGEPIKDVSFSFSLGNTDGDMVWDNYLVVLDEETIGVIQDNTAIPIGLPITSQDQVDLMNTISQENVDIRFEDFTYESVS